jgi:hypothetical protein
LEDVVKHKKVFFHTGYANYDDCLRGHLRLLPNAESLPGLKTDYGKMIAAGMMYGTAPRFDEIVEQIGEIERKINDWP